MAGPRTALGDAIGLGIKMFDASQAPEKLLIVLTDGSMYTLPVALANLLGEHAQDTELMMAGSVLTVLPVMLLFVALQKYYIAGIMLGGMKG